MNKFNDGSLRPAAVCYNALNSNKQFEVGHRRDENGTVSLRNEKLWVVNYTPLL